MITQDRKRSGYLLIELMVAVATIALCSVMAAYMQAHIAIIHKEAEQYLQAVNLASTQLMHNNTIVQDDAYTIEITKSKLDTSIAYKQIMVTISWNSPKGISKQIVIHGGGIDDTA